MALIYRRIYQWNCYTGFNSTVHLLGARVFGAVTYMGSSLMIVAVLCVLLWMFGRRVALRIAITFGCTALTNQLIKVICAVPRPWLRDSRLIPVDNAVAGATGYSFPAAYPNRYQPLCINRAYVQAALAERMLRGLHIVVMFSRLYLGVHTPLDVAVGCIISLGITYVLNTKLRRAEQNLNYFRNVFVCGILAAAGVMLLIFVSVALGTPFDMVGDALPAVGGALGFVSGIYLDSRNPEVLPPFGVGTLLCIAGLLVVSGLHIALDCALTPLLSANWRGFVCYAVLAFYVARVHPAAMRAMQRRFFNTRARTRRRDKLTSTTG